MITAFEVNLNEVLRQFCEKQNDERVTIALGAANKIMRSDNELGCAFELCIMAGMQYMFMNYEKIIKQCEQREKDQKEKLNN